MSAVIEKENLHKSYGGTVAVDDVSFAVAGGDLRHPRAHRRREDHDRGGR
ncbi:hypothetical protein ACQP1V_22225 [Microtetraspora malaysiensis]